MQYSISYHTFCCCTDFYSVSALLTVQTTVIARPFLSIRLSVTFRCFLQMNEDMIMQFSASGRTILLVSREVKFIRIFARYQPQWGHKSEALPWLPWW